MRTLQIGIGLNIARGVVTQALHRRYFSVNLGKCDDPSPTNGSTVEQNFSFGKWVTFRCDTGYVLVGESTLQCILGDMPNDCKWSGQLPICQCKLREHGYHGYIVA